VKLTDEDLKNMAIFGFRYALGRMSTAPSIMVNILKKIWSDLSEGQQHLIQREIQEAIDHDLAGMDCDVRTWEILLRLPLKGKQ